MQVERTWECQSCGSNNPESAKCCGECGKRKDDVVIDLWSCSKGHTNPMTVKFCHECGESKSAKKGKPEPKKKSKLKFSLW